MSPKKIIDGEAVESTEKAAEEKEESGQDDIDSALFGYEKTSQRRTHKRNYKHCLKTRYVQISFMCHD